jgi:hypothetical protein
MSGLVSASELHGHAQNLIPNLQAPWNISVSGARAPFSGSGSVTGDEGFGLNFEYDDVKRSTLRGAVSAKKCGTVLGLSVTHEQLPHTVTVSTDDKAITYGYAIECLQGSIKTQPLDGFPSSVSFATKITQGYFGAFTFDYDPFRSGLKSYTYGVLALAPSYFPKGDLSLTVQNPNKVTLAVSRKVSDKYKVHGVFTNSPSVSVAASYYSPCGAVLALSGNPLDRTVSLYTSRKIRDLFTFALSLSCNAVTLKPSAALSITLE